MQSVRVKIRGIAPMLQNRYPMEGESEEKARRRDEKFDPKEDAEKALYRNKDGCFVPSSWIEAALRDTAKEFKGKGRSSLKGAILSSVFVEPEEIPLGKQTYDEIDRRPAVIQRQRIVKSRPRFNSWEIEFTINFDEERVKKEILKEILIEAGKSKGIGDYRPKFGRFEVVKYE
jgi:hypothetical protein